MTVRGGRLRTVIKGGLLMVTFVCHPRILWIHTLKNTGFIAKCHSIPVCSGVDGTVGSLHKALRCKESNQRVSIHTVHIDKIHFKNYSIQKP